jgi:molecular chaperone HscB
MGGDEASVPTKCLDCHAELTSPIVCEGCRKLYPVPQSVDYFSLLGLERKYDLVPQVLQDRFLSISRHVHPDYFVGTAGQMQRLSVRLAAEINDAVKVLKDPVLRAAYMLELAGGPSGADDRAVPPEVLAEALTLREQIDEARQAGDAAALSSLRERVQARRDELVSAIAELARKLPEADDADRIALRRTINSVKYFDNMAQVLWD